MGGCWSPCAGRATWRLFDVATGALIRTLRPRNGAIGDASQTGFPVIAISPDGSHVAVWHHQIGVEIWDAASGESIGVLGGVSAIAPADPGETQWGPDLSALGIPEVVPFAWAALTFTADGSELRLAQLQRYDRVGAGSINRVVQVSWLLKPADLIAAACGIVGHDFTPDEWKQYVGETIPYHQTRTST